jgi:Protein of unknown function (DUF2917)
MSQIASIPTLASTPALASAAACLHARAGAFVLAPEKALALRPKQSSTIRITCGSAWVTINDGCDYFLTAEQKLLAPAGSRVVMESLRKDGVVMFDWQPELKASRARSTLRGSVDAVAAQAGLAPSPQEHSPQAQALLDLRGAVFLAARGFAGLTAALIGGLTRGVKAGFAEGLTGGLAARARSAHSSASRAQGRMASCESIASSGAA